MGEEINFWGSLLCFMGCMAFVVVYTAMAFLTGRVRWWHDHVGKMLVTKALAMAGLMALVLVYYAFHLDAEWIRGIRGVFASVIGVMMIYQTHLVYRLQRLSKEERDARR